MKLYATTTSERASKGQGGNKNLEIIIKGQELEGIPTRQDLFRLTMEVENGSLTAKILDYIEGEEILLYPRHILDDFDTSYPEFKQKGKSQKGEICRHCGKIHKGDFAICN